ncbi:carbohydrate binding domain protein, partial [Aspergillus ellipticus CBS 707.79]
TNPSFGTGYLSPWFTKVPNVAKVTNGTDYTAAFDGEYCLELTTAIDNGANAFSQAISGLVPRKTYHFSVYVQTPVGGVDYCYVSAWMGLNDTITTGSWDGSQGGEWAPITGTYTAKSTSDILSISGGCNSPDNSDTWVVWFDEVVLGAAGCGQ